MRILFIHGFASSGQYKMAGSLRILLRPCEVISPDVPIDPDKALSLLREICECEDPDLIVGHSLGGFWAQKLKGRQKILLNPGFHVSELMRKHLGTVAYLSPRSDGAKFFTVTEDICNRYETMERVQFEDLDARERSLTHGLFAIEDEMVRCGPEFERHYPGQATYYPGTHLPGFPQLKTFLVPLVHGIFPNFAPRK